MDLTYLARGLPPHPDRKRFALASACDREWWTFLGVTSIEYDTAYNHAALPAALREWVAMEGWGPLAHERRVQELVERPPEMLTVQEEGYLREFCLRDPTLARFFYRHASNPSWLQWWASQKEPLARLLEEREMDSEDTAALASWFASSPLSERGDVARPLAQTAEHLPRRLWERIASLVRQALDTDNLSEEAAQKAAQWLALLDRHSCAVSDHEHIVHWLKHLHPERHIHLAVQVFTYLTRPRGATESSFVVPTDDGRWSEPRPTVDILADPSSLKLYWRSFFVPNLDRFAHPLAPLIFAQFELAHVLLCSQGAASENLDPVSSGRLAIEPHEQDQHITEDAWHVVIDAARDILDWLIREAPDVANLWLEAGFRATSPLMRRLAIHGLTDHPRIRPARKLDLVIQYGWLRDPLLHHEVYRLLWSSYRDSATSARRRFLRGATNTYLPTGRSACCRLTKPAAIR